MSSPDWKQRYEELFDRYHALLEEVREHVVAQPPKAPPPQPRRPR